MKGSIRNCSAPLICWGAAQNRLTRPRVSENGTKAETGRMMAARRKLGKITRGIEGDATRLNSEQGVEPGGREGRNYSSASMGQSRCRRVNSSK